MELTLSLLAFGLLALSSKQIGELLSKLKLPLISGFLLTGILAGPYILKMLSVQSLANLRFIDDVSLAVIAFAAGNELFLKELRSRIKSIAWVTVGQVIFVFGLGSLAVVLLSGLVPFMRDMSLNGRIGVGLLFGSILVARSPSSAIAIVNELRAKGPFTQTALGVTMITDVLVIVLFSISYSLAGALLRGKSFDAAFLLVLVASLLTSFTIGFLLGKILEKVLSMHLHPYVKRTLVVLLGYTVFLFARWAHHAAHGSLHIDLHLEPLLICMIASFIITNYTAHRQELMDIIHDIAPPIYIAFFTLTGASLDLQIVLKTWSIALIFIILRLVTLFLGSWSMGTVAGDPPAHNRYSWMVYITQAGVGLGLAKQVGTSFPVWGSAFAALIISVIVVNQLIGPPFFKWAIQHIGEAHPKHETPEFDGHHDALIFGLDGRTLSLARELKQHDWQVRIATLSSERMEELNATDIEICLLEDISLASMKGIEADRADAAICFLSDEENLAISELFYEHFGVEPLLVLLKDRENEAAFRELGAIVIHPNTAVVNLFFHLARSPEGASFILGFGEEQDIVDFVLRDTTLHDVAIRDLNLPPDVMLLSVHRGNSHLIPHGHTLLELGDRISVVGSPASLEKMELLFEVENARIEDGEESQSSEGISKDTKA